MKILTTFYTFFLLRCYVGDAVIALKQCQWSQVFRYYSLIFAATISESTTSSLIADTELYVCVLLHNVACR